MKKASSSASSCCCCYCCIINRIIFVILVEVCMLCLEPSSAFVHHHHHHHECYYYYHHRRLLRPTRCPSISPSYAREVVLATTDIATTSFSTRSTTAASASRLLSKVDDDDDNDDTEDFIINEFDDLNTLGQQNRQWLIERFGFTAEKLSNKLDSPYRFNDTPTSTLNHRANWIQQRLDLTDKEMNKMIQKWPIILKYKTETNTFPTSDFLEKLFGKKSLKQMVLKNPRLLGISLEHNDHNLKWLQQRLALEDEQVSKIIYKCPEILGYSIEENLEPTLEWIQQRLSLTDEQVSKISCRFPSFLGCSIEENLEPTLEWIQQRLSLTDTGLSNLVVLQPELLGCNVTRNLAPKIDFYIEAADVEEGTVIGLLGRNPRLFTAGLKRLEHRLQEVREAGLIIDTGCLQRMAKEPPETWDRSLDYQRRKLDGEGGIGRRQEEGLW